MTVAVVMTTWDDGSGIRANYAQQAVASLGEHLYSTIDTLRLHIADDGTEEAIKVFSPVLEQAHNWWEYIDFTTQPHNGIGSSLNHALAQVDDKDMWLYTTDDWILRHKVNLDQAIRLLRNGYDYVRIGPIHPNLECVTRFQQGIGYWVEFVNETGFAFATRPFLATKAFYNKVGKFLEGANSYVVEQDYSLRCIRMRHQLKLGAVTIGGNAWEHIGDYEVGKYDIH